MLNYKVRLILMHIEIFNPERRPKYLSMAKRNLWKLFPNSAWAIDILRFQLSDKATSD